MMRRLWSFRGGVQLQGYKQLSNTCAIRQPALPAQMTLALRQHSGSPAIVTVETGQHVKKGQQIASAGPGISAALHAPTSGTIKQITTAAIAHPSGQKDTCIVLETDGMDEWCELQPVNNPFEQPVQELLKKISDAGVVGLGGAVFPSAVKLDPASKPDTLIINGVECEPYITCDDMLMRYSADRVISGIELLLYITGAKSCLVGIEDNKPEAIDAMRKAVSASPQSDSIEVIAVPTRFPAGGEKQLIYTLTGREVPSGGLPRDIGIVCNNVGTAAAIHDAIYKGIPLISRIVTVTGDAVSSPGNYEVLIGTPMQDLLEDAGMDSHDSLDLTLGGPMMGYKINTLNIAVTKGSNCLLARKDRTNTDSEASPCIRCGSCVEVCPAKLLPQQLYWFSRSHSFDKSEEHHLFDCIECGCCSHVCPSHIPLVEYFRFAKHAIAEQRRRQKKADIARQRNELRQARLEREKQEKEEARARRRAARKEKAAKPASNPDDVKIAS